MGRDARANTDRKIVAAVLANDKDQYAGLVERYQRPVFNMLRRMVRDADRAEELTQAVFVRAYFALPSYKPEYRFSTWLFQIAANLCANTSRTARREVPASDLEREDGRDFTADIVDGAPEPQDVVEQHDLSRAIRRAIDELPPDFRLVIVMRHMQELSYNEICEATGMPLGTVKSRLARARRLLAARLDAPAGGG